VLGWCNAPAPSVALHIQDSQYGWIELPQRGGLPAVPRCAILSVESTGGHQAVKRREFITLLGGATAAWPLVAQGQQGERVRRIGVITGGDTLDDPDMQGRMAAFLEVLRQLGWSDDRNLRIDYRWPVGDADRIRRYAAELVELAPDVILTTGTATMAPLLQATRTIPIVFVSVADPVGAGFVDSLARPGGNTTGFMQFEYSLSGKWLELLKEIAPRVMRAAVLRDPAISSGTGQFGAIQSVASSLGVELTPVNVREPLRLIVYSQLSRGPRMAG
jgi:ABC-type uncharacterized transport system substrate-binding protein